MALIDCPECGNKNSDTAEFCPNCGYVYDFEDFEEHRAEGVASVIIGIIAWIIMLLIPFLSFASFIIFVIALILQRKCQTNLSFVGFAISSLGIAFLTIGILI